MENSGNPTVVSVPPIEGTVGGGTMYGWSVDGLHASHNVSIDPTQVSSADLVHVWSMPSTANVCPQEMLQRLNPAKEGWFPKGKNAKPSEEVNGSFGFHDLSAAEVDYEMHIPFTSEVGVKMQPSYAPAQSISPATPARSALLLALHAPAKARSSSHPLVKCPMAGTFYWCPGPGEPPFVKVGDKVQKGQVICIIEAMKLMNEI